MIPPLIESSVAPYRLIELGCDVSAELTRQAARSEPVIGSCSAAPTQSKRQGDDSRRNPDHDQQDDDVPRLKGAHSWRP